jgi:hypothetical protein
MASFASFAGMWLLKNVRDGGWSTFLPYKASAAAERSAFLPCKASAAAEWSAFLPYKAFAAAEWSAFLP